VTVGGDGGMPGWGGGATTAPACQNIVYDPLYGVRVCADTGEVLEEHILDEGADWRAYTPEERVERPRAGPPVRWSQAGMGVGASLGGRNKPGAVRAHGLAGGAGRDDGGRPRLAKPAGRGLRRALGLIAELCAALGLPGKVVEEASRIYREAHGRGQVAGRPAYAAAAASTYLACGITGEHRPLGDVVRALHELEPGLHDRKRATAEQEVRRAVKLLVRNLGVKPKPVKPEDLIPALASELGLPASTAAEAVKTLEAARRKGLHSGKHPAALAVATLYIASSKDGKKKVTMKALARATGLTPATIRARVRELESALGNSQTN
jgi:transcription initiation factor TFIIB